MQYRENFRSNAKEKGNFDIFNMFAQNIDCGYTLEPPRQGGSNEYPQSMSWIKNKKKNVYRCIARFNYIKVGYEGIYVTRTCYSDAELGF